MYCPQCGTESSSGLQYCRSCGANLKVIGKALTLSEAIARSDRGPIPKIKEMFKNLHIERVTDEVSRAMDRMNTEILRSSKPLAPPAISMSSIEKKHDRHDKHGRRKEKTAEERRESQIVKGTVSLFTGIGLTIFLYYLSAVLVLKLPPDVIAKIPFELEPVIRVIWLLGLVPALSGVGHIVAGLLIRPTRQETIDITSNNQASMDAFADQSHSSQVLESTTPSIQHVPTSVTEHTTNLLEPRE